MKKLTDFRNRYFERVGENRLSRILFCTCVIILFWALVDYLSDGAFHWSNQMMFLRLGLGFLVELIIPWGKVPKQNETHRIHYVMSDSNSKGMN